MSTKFVLRAVVRGNYVTVRYQVTCRLERLMGDIWQVELTVANERAEDRKYPQHRFLADDPGLAKGKVEYYMRTRVAECLGIHRVGVVVLGCDWAQVDD